MKPLNDIRKNLIEAVDNDTEAHFEAPTAAQASVGPERDNQAPPSSGVKVGAQLTVNGKWCVIDHIDGDDCWCTDQDGADIQVNLKKMANVQVMREAVVNMNNADRKNSTFNDLRLKNVDISLSYLRDKLKKAKTDAEKQGIQADIDSFTRLKSSLQKKIELGRMSPPKSAKMVGNLPYESVQEQINKQNEFLNIIKKQEKNVLDSIAKLKSQINENIESFKPCAGKSYLYKGKPVRCMGGGTPTTTWIISSGGGQKIQVKKSDLSPIPVSEELNMDKDPVEKWIDDYVKSSDPAFKGMDKSERIKKALSDFNAKQRALGKDRNLKVTSEGVNEDVGSDELTITRSELDEIADMADDLYNNFPNFMECPAWVGHKVAGIHAALHSIYDYFRMKSTQTPTTPIDNSGVVPVPAPNITIQPPLPPVPTTSIA